MTTKSDRGWIYCITNSIYKNENLYKIGMTSQIALEEEVKTKLLQRYGTSFIDPEILFLQKVSFPKKVEKLILEELINYRNGNTEMITADFINIINPILFKITNIYPYDNPIYIEDDIYNKLVFKLQKNMEKLVKNQLNNNYTMNEHIKNYITKYFNTNLLNSNNNERLCPIYNRVFNLNPPVSGSPGYIYNENQKKLRKNWELTIINELKFNVSQWDKKDPIIHKFLKDFSKIV